MPKLDRRTFLATGAVVGLGEPLLAKATVAPCFATRLRTAMREVPLGIDDPAPTLSWQLGGAAPGLMQSAYRVLVATGPDPRPDGQDIVWDSGKVEGGQCTGIVYGGEALQSKRRYFWRVMLWDHQQRASGWSASACWEMGLLSASDWAGDWIAVESLTERMDRESMPEWVEVDLRDRKERKVRLSFVTAGGDATLILSGNGRFSSLTVAGRSLPFPERDPNGYGGPPASEHRLALAAGRHVVELAVASNAPAEPAVRLAGLLRIATSDGRTERFHSGWQIQNGEATTPHVVPKAAEQPHFPWPATPARLLRRNFDIEGRPVRARLYVAVLGGYRIWINGEGVSQDELQAEPAEYLHHIPYRTYDVTRLVQAGSNAVGAIVGDGFYASYQAPDGRYAYGPAPRRIRLMLEVEAENGTIQRITTDGEWKHRVSPVLMSESYNGEDHDLRMWPAGWSNPGFAVDGWDAVWSAPAPSARLVAPLGEPIRCTRTLNVQSVRQVGPDNHILDFGQNFAGRVRLRVKGRAGDKIIIRHAEILDAMGNLDRRNLRVARAEDHYILNGGRTEILESLFTYQGFRYAQIDGVAHVTTAMVDGLVLSSAIPEIGMLRIDNPLIQKLWMNNLWSQRSNFMGIPTDCPQRDERLGWTGDTQIFWDTAAFNMNVGGFTRSYMRTMRADQAANGAFPMWTPSPKGLGWGTETATPGWADAGVMLPFITYLHTGDRQVVEENWSAMERYVLGVLDKNGDGLWRVARGADLGDWLALDAKQPGDPTTPKDLIATAMLARSIAQLEQMASWTGREERARYWKLAGRKVGDAFARAFVRADGSIGNGSQCGYILALRLGLVPQPVRSAAARYLVADIRKRGTLLSTGFLGTPLALDALADAGEKRLVFDLLLRTAFPSWGYMVQRGATTTWERWNGDVGDVVMNSYNHYALGAVGSFIYRRLAGVEPTSPGFRTVRVAPLSDQRVGTVGVRLDSPQGVIETHCAEVRGQQKLSLTLPPNVEAEVIVGRHREIVRGGTHEFHG